MSLNPPPAVELYDIIVIGGGPGGSSSACYLLQAGLKVLLLEREHFPRFHIGESLLPYNRRIFEEIGVQSKLEAAGFLRKFGAQFHLGNGSKGTKFVFKEGRFTKFSEAIQVERAVFDDILLKHAAEQGAEVREGWTVKRVEQGTEIAEVLAASDKGETVSFKARYIIDASGRGNMTGNQEGIREVHPRLKKLAVFGHFKGVKRDEGPKETDTIIVRLDNKWFWIIPLTAEKTSVGCVMDNAEFGALKQSPREVFQRFVDASLPMRERMMNAELCGQVQTTGDFSYRNKSFYGPRLLRVGDAAGFMDPIFSAGVFLAMFSGKLAAQAIIETLKRKDNPIPRFQAYERRVYDSMKFYWKMVENFYTTPFMEVFLEPRKRFNLPAAVNAVLAGELEGGWRMRWRLGVFFWIIKMQARYPLLPRISFQ
ncbi:MAG: NAD(P)/FAD-dependent oxidoreductase [Verrucomicrobiota bacterium]